MSRADQCGVTGERMDILVACYKYLALATGYLATAKSQYALLRREFSLSGPHRNG